MAEHNVGKISFIKCDVEGHEFQVFQGGESVLSEDHPTLLFECYDSEAADGELFGYLERFAHVHTSLQHRNYLFVKRGSRP